MQCGLAGVVFVAVACGPTVDVPTESASAGGTAGNTADDSDGSAVEASSAGSESQGTSSSPPNPTMPPMPTGPMPDGTSSSSGTDDEPGLPPEEGVLGVWLCEGAGLPFVLRVETAEGTELSGAVCVASDQGGPPESWDSCAELGNHSQIGFPFHIVATIPGAAADYPVEFGFSYIAKTDTLEGGFFPSEPPYEPQDEACTRL